VTNDFIEQKNVIHVCPRFVSVFSRPHEVEISQQKPVIMQRDVQIMQPLNKIVPLRARARAINTNQLPKLVIISRRKFDSNCRSMNF
jgi:hypothetical protein